MHSEQTNLRLKDQISRNETITNLLYWHIMGMPAMDGRHLHSLLSNLTTFICIYSVSKKIYCLRFSEKNSQRLRFFKMKCYTPIVCSYLHYTTKFYSVASKSLTLTKLCHIKGDHLVNFYI